MKIRAAVTAAAFFLTTASLSCAQESSRNTAVVKVVKEWAPSVVNISTERVVIIKQQPYWRAYGGAFEEFFKENTARQAVSAMRLKGIGSGVIVSKDGLIVTNAHVVKMASKVYVILSDGVTAEATVPAVSWDDDIAILKINPPENLKPIKLADDAMVGETVVSIGNPFGLENSVSVGIISGTNRGFSDPKQNLNFRGLIQTDASINIGSSGGALINLDGELTGINLAVIQGAQSIGFAIPASRIKDILRQYEEYLKKASQTPPPAR